MALPIPHLIHVGCPKAGSTFLQNWFSQHPEVLYHHGSLGGFEDLFDVCRFGADPQIPIPRCLVTSGETLSNPYKDTGTLNVNRHFDRQRIPVKPSQQKVCEVLHALFPQSQILIVTRGFRSIFQSSYSQRVKFGYTQRPQAMFEMVQQSDLHMPFDFNFLIGLYTRSFGAENVLVLPYELLRDDSAAFLRILEAKLGLSHVELPLKRLNPSLSPAELYWYPLLSRRVFALTKILPRGAQKVQRLYIRSILNNRWQRAIRLLERKWPHKTIGATDFPLESLQLFRGQADCLRDNPLYAPYAADYLWT